jgi:MoxR-like ATPase
MSFDDDASCALNKLVATVTGVYRGYWQHLMVEAVFCGLLMGEPVLLIGSHGAMKTSIANFIGGLFDKPITTLKTKHATRSDLERWFEELASELKIDPENLMKNLVDGIDVQYEQTTEGLAVGVEVDLLKHPLAESHAKSSRKPLKVFSMQVNDQMDPEDLLGYGVDHPALLGQKPSHAIKTRRVAGADYVVFDEIFGAIRLLSKLHHVLNEKVIDTTVGAIETKPVGIILCTNPLNDFYQTNLKIINAATTDRYALSARSLPPSTQEILVMAERWQNLELTKQVPLEMLYEARKHLGEVKIPDEYLIFSMGLISHLSRCYFSVSTGVRAKESKDPFEAEKDCSLCIYGKTYPCGLANIGKVRTILRLKQTIQAHALLNLRQQACEEDLAFALLHVLPHRLSWNSAEFLAEHGSIFTATKALVERYAELFVAQQIQMTKIEALIKKPNAHTAVELGKVYKDAPIARALLDDVVDMIKEAAKKKQDTKTLNTLEDKLNIQNALKTLTPKQQPPLNRSIES